MREFVAASDFASECFARSLAKPLDAERRGKNPEKSPVSARRARFVLPFESIIPSRRRKLVASGHGVIVSPDREIAPSIPLPPSLFAARLRSGAAYHLGRESQEISPQQPPMLRKPPLGLFVAVIMAPVCQNMSKHNPDHEILSRGRGAVTPCDASTSTGSFRRASGI